MTFNTNKQKKFIIFSRKHRDILFFSVQTFIIFVQINKHLSAPKKNIAESVKGKKEYPFLLKEDKKKNVIPRVHTRRMTFSNFIYFSVKTYTLSRPWQFLYFKPLPQGQGSLRPTVFSARYGSCFASRVSRPAAAC